MECRGMGRLGCERAVRRGSGLGARGRLVVAGVFVQFLTEKTEQTQWVRKTLRKIENSKKA